MLLLKTLGGIGPQCLDFIAFDELMVQHHRHERSGGGFEKCRRTFLGVPPAVRAFPKGTGLENGRLILWASGRVGVGPTALSPLNS